MFNRFAKGFRAPIEGFLLLRSDKKLLRLSAAPVAVTIFLIILGIAIVNRNVDAVYMKIIFYLINFIVAYLIASVVAIPLNSIIAKKLLLRLGVISVQETSYSEKLKTFFLMLRVSIVKAVIILVFSVILFISSFLPGISALVLFGGLILFGFDCIDYSLEALELNLKQRLDFLRSYLPEICGFAFFLGIIFCVPFINLVMLPVAVAGGAYLVDRVDYVKKRSS